MSLAELRGVVGVGASAGGLEALSELVSAIPAQSGLAFVVVQHLSPDHTSIMGELLASHTTLPVLTIEDGMVVAPDFIYVIPAGPALKIASGRFQLVPRDTRKGLRTPIDVFLASLAEDFGEISCCVILSGTGSDGTMGLKAIKNAGGIAIVQEAMSARFAGMPDSAAATGLVDARLKPADVPANILSLLAHRDEIRNGDTRNAVYDAIAERLNNVIDLLATKESEDFSSYKPGTLVRRIERRMMLRLQPSIDGYYDLLTKDEEERRRLLQDFLIGVTRFFRDTKAFHALKEMVVAPLLARDQEKFRIWVPGCSTGEEAYSIAILFAEALREADDRREFQIFGTDIDMNALRHARTALYSEAVIDGMPSELVERYFTTVEGGHQINFRLRERVAFAPHNLLRDPPFSRIDFVSCRNLLIYLNTDGQNAVMPRFHYALKKSGFLFLGPSESVDGKGSYFTSVSRDYRIYRRNDATTVGFSALSGRRPLREVIPRQHVERGSIDAFDRAQPLQSYEAQVDQFFLSRHSAPFLVVNSDDQVSYISGTVSPYVRLAKGAPSARIEDLLTPEIRSIIRPLVSAVREKSAAVTETFPVTENGASHVVRITAESLPFSFGDVLVVLQPVDLLYNPDELKDTAGNRGSIEAAEQELALVRRRLTNAETGHAIAEQELRSANEELLSMNEELQSSNEELETSREELQSINEELETINAELSENNARLNEVNSDLKNVLDSTDIAKLILAKNLIVRRFTRSTRDILTIDERDVGRNVTDLKWHVDYPELPADVEKVETTLQVIERELRNERTGEYYEVRVRPYRSLDDKLDGCIITFVDITRRKTTERELQESREQLGAALAAGDLGVHVYYPQTNRLVWDDRMRDLWNVSSDRVIDYDLFMDRLHPDDREKTQIEVNKALDPSTGGQYLAEYRVMQPDGSAKWIRADGKMRFEDGKPERMVGTVKDITRRHEEEMQMRQYAARLELTYEVTGIGAWEWQMDGDVSTWSPTLYDLLKADRDIKPSLQAFSKFIVEEDRQRVKDDLDTALETDAMFDSQFRIIRGDGEKRVLVGKGRLIRDGAGKPTMMIGINYDVTEEVAREERRELLTSELNHRVKNSLATIQSIAAQTLRNSDDIDAFKTSFLGRLRAISKAHDLLVNGGANDANVADLVSSQVSPYAGAGRGQIKAAGPRIILGASVAHGLGLVLHELATNASKYGALSTEAGHVAIEWSSAERDGKPAIRMTWRESGGPPVTPPTRTGFGSMLIEKSLSHSIGGETTISYPREGVVVVIECPVRAEVN